MTVYLVIGHHPKYGDDEVVCVCESETLAHTIADHMNGGLRHYRVAAFNVMGAAE